MIIFILLVSVGVGGYFFYNSKKLIVKYDKKVTVNINEIYQNVKAIKKVKNGTIQTKIKKVNTSKVGEQ